jgi:L-lactate dehydrogenase complex protein LldG
VGEAVNARDEIFGRIRLALADRPAVTVIPRDYHGTSGTDLDDPVALLERRLVDYKATVRRCSEAEIPAMVAAAFKGRGRVVVPPELQAGWVAGLDDVLYDDPPISVRDLDAAGGVITSCAVAIALTGTIVLDHGAGQGRRALTLVPDYLLAVVRLDQIVAGVPDAIALLDPIKPQTWISGPSATSDIELNRVEGVHGPRTLEVIIAG